MRWFNTAGPCQADTHYTLLEREGVPDLRRLIDRRQYFVLHAPRQTGKTTTILNLAQALIEEGRYAAVALSVEVGAPFNGERLAMLEGAVLGAWRTQCRARLPESLQPPPWPDAQPGQRLRSALAAWASASARPLVLFVDEVDALQEDALISVLRQLRDGFPDRPGHFPHSMGLVGMRDVRDYVVASGGRGRLGSASPFNVKVASIRIGDFTRAEVEALLGQHSAETGQPFTPSAVERVWTLTRGQPWLVNALAAQAIDVLVPDRAVPIDAADVDRARDALVKRQDTHLDSLAERLREPRVRAVIEPILAGQTPEDLPPDDVRYVIDLGLVRRSDQGGLTIANPIYREVIPTSLASNPRNFMPAIAPSWLDDAGRLVAAKLLSAFLDFWRRNGEPLMRSAPYHEVAPHLVMMAFLDRVSNGGGRVEREYAIGSGRMDLCLMYGTQRLAMELKVWRPGEPDPLAEGLTQLDGYLAGLGLETGWLVIFDRRPGIGRLAERTGVEAARTASGREVVVVRG
ncbi:MAG: ATP-binding protein [Alphaproteobacteria bacterium]|nr:ATP-binding protein [Alphaproteobacteria bacterium]